MVFWCLPHSLSLGVKVLVTSSVAEINRRSDLARRLILSFVTASAGGRQAESVNQRALGKAGNAWLPLGSDIDGEAFGDVSSSSLTMSAADGLAIDAPAKDNSRRNAAQSGLYVNFDTSVVRRGGDRDSEAEGCQSGCQPLPPALAPRLALRPHIQLTMDPQPVAVRAAGTSWSDKPQRALQFVVVDAPPPPPPPLMPQPSQPLPPPTSSPSQRTPAPISQAGSAWLRLGSDIDGEASGDQSGSSVAMSADGLVVAIGAPQNDGSGFRIYAYTGNAWVKRGADIDGEAASDASGYTVPLSGDGLVLAIGAFSNNGTAGHVRVWEYISSSWVRRGSDIEGQKAGDLTGRSVSLSADGTILAVGFSGNDAGSVRVFRYSQAAANRDGRFNRHLGRWRRRGQRLVHQQRRRVLCGSRASVRVQLDAARGIGEARHRRGRQRRRPLWYVRCALRRWQRNGRRRWQHCK